VAVSGRRAAGGVRGGEAGPGHGGGVESVQVVVKAAWRERGAAAQGDRKDGNSPPMVGVKG
jgi:hypothetical protein